jgi:hypothetical protein
MNLAECYTTLGLEKTYDEKQVKSTYRTMAKAFHPDVNQHQDTTEHFRRIKEAYETILLFIEFRNNHGADIGQMIIDEEQKQENDIMERVARARQMKQEKRDREQALIKKIYHTYTHSWRIFLSGVLLLLGLLTSYFLAYDFKTQGDSTMSMVESTSITNKDKPYEDFYVHLSNGTTIAVDPDLYENAKKGKSLLIEQGHYFGEVKALLEIKGKSFIVHEPISYFNDAWLFLIVLLLIPLFSFLLLKPTFIFVFFFVHFNLYIQPLVLAYVLLGDGRIVYLWNILMH